MTFKDSLEISVIIPCWNVAPWLPRCLNEVFAALPDSAEVIAVDDGSADATLEILSRFAIRRPELKIISQSNKGVSSARNRGLDIAQGKYIFFVDPDDGVERDFFTAMLDRIKTTNADYCICAFKTRLENGSFQEFMLRSEYEFDSGDKILEGFVSRIVGYSFDDVNRWYKKREPLFESREMASVWRCCFRRELIEKLTLRFDERISLYEDAVFNVEYLLSAKKMTCLNRALYRVTKRDSGAMTVIPRDALRLARNKLHLLGARLRLDAISCGKIWRLCEASAVFSMLEIFSLMLRFKLGWREGSRILREYSDNPRVRIALRDFPLSWRRPLIGVMVLFLRRLYAYSIIGKI